MKFGNKEIKEFAENHEDERVRVMYRRLCEARSKNALWCNKVAELESEIAKLKAEKKNNWWPHAGAGSWNKLDSITAEHLSQCKIDCEYCCGTGQIAVTVSVDSKTRESQFGYSKCRKCDGRGYL